MNRNKALSHKLLLNAACCELCGCKKGLEVHHIIPKVCEIDGVDLEQEDNLIVLCSSCHAKLTPRSILTSYGLNKGRKDDDNRVKFYTLLNEQEGHIDAAFILNVFDSIYK